MKNKNRIYLNELRNTSCNEAKLQETIERSKAALVACETGYSVSAMEFLYQQSRYIRKRWWILQGMLLMAICWFMCVEKSEYHIRRSLGVGAPLFVILILPELWKNRNANAMEVECTTFFGLRQIYGARLTLFAGVDLILLTLLFISASFLARVTFWEMMIQFLLPFNVACGICFRFLYSKRIGSEALSVLLCTVFSGLWVMIVLNDDVYHAISIPMWAAMLLCSCFYMGFCICHGQKRLQQSLEVKFLWN